MESAEYSTYDGAWTAAWATPTNVIATAINNILVVFMIVSCALYCRKPKWV